jgi:hypothetical protein
VRPGARVGGPPALAGGAGQEARRTAGAHSHYFSSPRVHSSFLCVRGAKFSPPCIGRRGISRGRAAARMQHRLRQCAAAALLSSVGDGGHYPGMTAVVQPLLRLPARAVVRGHTPLLLFVASTAEALLPWAALLPAAAA